MLPKELYEENYEAINVALRLVKKTEGRKAQVAPKLQRGMTIGIYLAVTAKRNSRSTASNLSRQLSSATGTTVSRQTVYRRLGHIGLYARRPCQMCSTYRNSLSPAINLE
ncbi:HTH_Tnp_Tc3_2 domain-containing protein [Trichonephila clavipes]|nr:HTH_Tnp_Tc3_2 domain-containing protein [Trichonephila clavipes]